MFTVREVSEDSVEKLASQARVHALTARCLIARGASNADAARRFMDPKLSDLRAPIGLADLDRAVERLATAVTIGETVGVFGDYDVDGVTTAALLSSAIEAMGGRAVPRVARRSAGYGFGIEDVNFFADSMCHLIITGDCGTNDIDATNAANKRGLDVLVVDHHTVPSDVDEHPAFALINPFRPDSSFEFTGFASVGLAFYLMQRLRTVLREAGHFRVRPQPDLRYWLDLVALGTVADLVPLTNENRILTTAGLAVLNMRKRPGIASLLRAAGVQDSATLGEREIGWRLGPRLNAPGRLGDAEPALRLLLSTSTSEADALAATLEQLNSDRREAQDIAYAEALEMIEASPPGPCAVVAGRGWLPGVVGIVAARLVDVLERPVFAIAIDDDGVARGSARTHGGVNVYNALAQCADVVGRFGGHAAAAGLTMSADNIEALRGGLEAAVRAQQVGRPIAAREADAEVGIGQLAEADRKPSKLASELESLRPFGKGNPELRLVVRGVEVLEARPVGKERAHLKLVLGDGGREIGAIGFGLGGEAPAVGSRIDLLCSPLINRWRGQERAELQVHALSESNAHERLELPGHEGESALTPAAPTPAALTPAALTPAALLPI